MAAQPPVPDTNVAVELPKSSENALKFIENLGLIDFTHILFDDALVTTSDAGSEVGEFSVTIECSKWRGEECFLVHANSHGAVDNVPCGTSITTYVGKNLQTLEQELHEYIKLADLPLDRKTYLLKQPDGYMVNKVITQGQTEQKLTRVFDMQSMEGFISEGSNLLLHRLLITKGMPDNFQLVSFDTDTNLCLAAYRSLGERKQHISGTDINVFGIERTIESESDLPTTWQSYFTVDGHMTNRVQVGSPVTMKVLRVPTPVDKDSEPPKPIFEQKPLNWENDLQMYSTYLDRKEELKADHDLYMRRHPELRALVADFLQFLLLRKPDDVPEFAKSFFSPFSRHIPDTS